MTYHIHGTGNRKGIDYTVSLTVEAESDDEAQRKAWAILPDLDIGEIEEA